MIAIVSTIGQFQAKDYLGNESTLNLQFFRKGYPVSGDKTEDAC
jgi:hypothetical protein